jgi:[ribosomal protein S5]-alanine N-acetyltransferase
MQQIPARPARVDGRRVYLRPPAANDLVELIDLNRRSVDHHRPWVAAPVTPEEAETYLARAGQPDTACFLVIHRETDAIMGVVNLSQIFYGNFQSAYMGYYIGAPYARQGYMRDAVAAALGCAFSALGLHRVEANIQPGNSASIGVVRALGFRREGYSPRYLKIEGEWRDHERWAILAEDYLERGP